MNLPTYLSLPFEISGPLPKQFKYHDVRYPPNLVKYFISHLTAPNDVVFDPFTGFGTTLVVAKKLGRRFVGTEILEDRIFYLKNDLQLGSSVINTDLRRFDLKKLGIVDFVMTSPPFMGRSDPANALTGYQYSGSYEEYLTELGDIFRRIRSILKQRGYLVIEASNLKENGQITTLAWDIANIVKEYFQFRGEMVITWQGEKKENGIYGYGYDHSYCLIFQK